MNSLAGCRVLETLHEDPKTGIYRALRATQNGEQNVVIKTLRASHPPLEEIAQLRHEFQIARSLSLDGVLQPLDLLAHENSFVLLLEDFDGISLHDYLLQTAPDGLDLDEFLPLALSLTEIIGQIHAQGVIHKDIKPDNIFINAQSGQLKLGDFGIASHLASETPVAHSLQQMQGTLAYMSPEQTGRMNQPLDYRSDFYSLGVTFYQMLTGRLPFESQDAMELVHAHLARTPATPPGVPPMLSAVVLKLLAKTARERYQSAAGVRADLQECRAQWENNKTIAPFELARFDRSDELHISTKIYGRDAEIAVLLDAFESAASGERELVMIAGYSGIGKTSVVGEVHKPIVARRGWFAQGKFDQFRRDSPYTALIQAFRELIRQVLTESEQELARFKTELLDALGSNGQLLIEVIPEIELIVGPQPPVAALGPQESLNRFNFVLGQFVRVWAHEKHPLTLFLDDLQWASDASLRVLQTLITDWQTHHLLIVGAYRDNEVSASHPLILTLEEIRKSGGSPREITLGPLPARCIEELLEESLHGSPAQLKPLAELLEQRTQGNPFFLNQLLKSWHENKWIVCEDGRWSWDLKTLGAANLSGDVVDLMAGKIQTLPLATQEIIKLAACIGNRFDAQTLATVRETDSQHIARDLWEALRAGLISPLGGALGGGLRPPAPPNDGWAPDEANTSYKFLHDRVQQAAYSLVSERERPAFHLKIGRLLRADAATRDEQLFDIVGHLNEARALITDEDERHNLVRLNLEAGLKAKASVAYGAALNYFAVAQEIAPATLWKSDYPTMFALARERSECEYLQGNFERAETQFELALQHAQSALDRAAVEVVRVKLYTTRNDYERAIRVGLEGLAALGLVLPVNPHQTTILRALVTAKRLQGTRSIASLVNLPHLKDPRRLAQIELLAVLSPALFLSANRSLFALASLQNVHISLRSGNSVHSISGYASYAVMLAAALGDAKKGVAFGEMSRALAEQFDDAEARCRALFTLGCYLRHHRYALKGSEALVEQSYRLALECGNAIYAGYGVLSSLAIKGLRGARLDEIERSIEDYWPFLLELQDADVLLMTSFNRQLCRNLRGATSHPLSMSDADFDESAVQTGVENGAYTTAVQCGFYVLRARLCAFWGDWAGALKNSRAAEPLMIALTSTPHVQEHCFLYALAVAAHYAQANPAERAILWKQLRKNHRKMKKWALNAPDNYRHMQLLIEAEMARIKGRESQAAHLYDASIRAARDAEYVQNEGLANELAAHFYQNQERATLARAYSDEARYLYAKWGATAKVAALDAATAPPTEAKPLDHQRTTSGKDKSFQLDLSTVIKASQAISGEIDLGRLLQQLLRFALENAGATRGALILRRDEKFFVEAVGASAESEMALPSQPLEECGNYLPLSVIQFVARTRENVMLSDAAHQNLFAGDSYLAKRDIKSVLCAPIVHQTKLNGLIYLENHLVAGAFTPQRLEVLGVLSAQAAISLQNARLYEQLKNYSLTLKQRVSERTAELSAKNGELEQTLHELQQMQERIIVQEKMASLGALTAGIAHEIKNPLNFVNNFALVSIDLTDELREETDKLLAEADEETRAYLGEILDDLQGNARKISEHGARADSIVRGMLLHSRGQAGEREATDLNALVHEAVQLAYHGQRAHDASFNISIEEDYDANIGQIQVLPHEISRVILNLANNACYAANKKAARLRGADNADFAPMLCVKTRVVGANVNISVADNGDGIPAEARKSIFTPFFTTKPTGEGTGLGLSMSYEIVVQQHGGQMSFESSVDTGTTFIIQLPYHKNRVL